MIEKERGGKEEELEEEEVGPRSLLRSNMLSPHEVLSLPSRVHSPLPVPTKPFSRSGGYVPPLLGAPSHLINVLIAVNDSEISLTRPKMENERETGYHRWDDREGRVVERKREIGGRWEGGGRCLSVQATTTRTNALPPGSLTLFVAAVHCTLLF